MLNQPTLKRTIARIGQTIALVATVTLMLPTSARAQVTYDLGAFPFEVFGGTEVQATLETSTTGTFTTVADIENFLNSATYSVVVSDGSTTTVDLNNSNASWSLNISALSGGTGGATATLTATATEITLDFSTPNDVTSVSLVLRDGFDILQYDQANNVSDFNFVSVEHDAFGDAYVELAYDDPFVFPAVVDDLELSFYRVFGDITTDGGQIQYGGSSTGWIDNHADSGKLSTYRLFDNYEVSFLIDSNPADSLWVVGLRRIYSYARWQEIEHAIRNSNGRMMVFESGTWRTSGPQLSQGDIVSIFVNAGVVEYRLNGDAIYTSATAGSVDYFVTATFKNGAAALDTSLHAGSVPPPPLPSGSVPITDWVKAIGGVSTSANTVSYSGTPTGWVNSVNSHRLSALGGGDDYEVSWVVESDPTLGIWVVGLGVEESRSNWRDVDYAFRNSNGFLTIHESGVFSQDVAPLSVGDVLSMQVIGTSVWFRLNGIIVRGRGNLDTDNLYIDTAFKNGASSLSFFLAADGATPPPPPPGSIPITNWTGATGGVSTSKNNVSYSGSPTGWSNSVNSARLATLGATEEYRVSWTVDSNPINSLWVVGIGDSESSNSWRDIEYAVRNSNGLLHVYRNNEYHYTVGETLSIGDVVSIEVTPNCVGLNLSGRDWTSTCHADWDRSNFYIDTAFKNGAAELGSFVITND